MSVMTRGVRNAFRNNVRSASVILILAISIGLALVMLLSMKTVQDKITSVKGSIGNTITVSPAGARGFEGGGEPLTADNVKAIQAVGHVTKVTQVVNDRLETADTNLVSSIEAGSLGRRFRRFDSSSDSSSGTTQTFTPPIQVTGTTDPTSTTVNQSSQMKVTSGATFDGTKDANVALVGAALATKNNLKVGSTFTLHGATVTVAGIYDAGNTFSNAGVIMPLSTIQRLSGQANQVSEAIVTVDSITNVKATTDALTSKLGSAADVVSSEDRSESALAPLENIKTISFYSLIGSLAAGSIIIFLTMLMIVRERRREIGVLKAIGSSNVGIMGQFIAESLTLTLLGAVAGTIVGVLLSNPILKMLATSSASSTTGSSGGMGGARVMFGGPGGGFGGVRNAVSNLQATVGWDILLYGLLAAVVIAILGSAIPAWLIAKVRPAEVMRAE
jgi:putative ABC transport system permease protein